MARYAVILSGTVENVVEAATAPTYAGRTVVALTATQPVSPGDSYNGSVFTQRVPSARETAFSLAPDILRTAYPTLVQWAADAQATYDAAVAGNRALTAAEQREFIRRVGVLLGRMATLLLKLDLDS